MPELPQANQPGQRSPIARRAKVEDAPAMARINVAGWRLAYRGLVPDEYLDAMDETNRQQRWTALMTSADNHWGAYVAEIGGQVVAYASGGDYRTQQDAPLDEDTRGWGELYAIYSDPDRQGQGAGTVVHDAMLRHLCEQGFARGALWVLRDNVRTIGWYKRRGWRADGAVSDWSGAGTPLREIRLVRDLG